MNLNELDIILCVYFFCEEIKCVQIMKAFKYISLITLALMGLVSCREEAQEIVASSISLDHYSVDIPLGQTFHLIATVFPENTTDKTIAWSSSDESVAKVDEGLVTTFRIGRTTVRASCGNKYASCVVKVTPIDIKSVTLNKTSATLKAGETVTLTATVKPDDATDKTITWITSDASVAIVDEGVVTAKKVGKAAITAKAGDKTAICTVTVVPTPVTSITLNKTSASLKVGETVALTATVKPDDATDKTVNWSTSDESVASVKNGTVTAKKVGIAVITAVAGDKSATCTMIIESTVSDGKNEDVGFENWDD